MDRPPAEDPGDGSPDRSNQASGRKLWWRPEDQRATGEASDGEDHPDQEELNRSSLGRSSHRGQPPKWESIVVGRPFSTEDNPQGLASLNGFRHL